MELGKREGGDEGWMRSKTAMLAALRESLRLQRGDGLRWVVWEGVEGAGAELRRRVPGASFFRYVVGREPWILAGLRADQRLRSLRSPLV